MEGKWAERLVNFNDGNYRLSIEIVPEEELTFLFVSFFIFFNAESDLSIIFLK
jgi:hypothetical protein